jgi:hypothetical protein
VANLGAKRDRLIKKIEYASRRAEKCFRKHGEVMPQYRPLDGDAEWFIVPARLRTRRSKQPHL